MKFSSADNGIAEADVALREAIAAAKVGLGGLDADLVVVFTSGHDARVWDGIPSRLRTAFPKAVTLGCTAEGTIGSRVERERQPSVVVVAASLPGVDIVPFSVDQDSLENERWPALPVPEAGPVFLTLGDPFSIDVRGFLSGLEKTHPRCPVVGGMASGGNRTGTNRLLVAGTELRDGLVGVALTGNVAVDAVVSQGCRPVGRPYVVTQGSANVILGLRNEPALKILREMASELPEEDQQLLEHGIFLGRAIDEYKSDLGRGDFLIHSVIQADSKTGAVAIAGEVKVGTTVQFHVRDAASADEDLRSMLEAASGEGRYAGALLFSCNGRGTRMWDEPGHDAGALADQVGPIPVGGFFCAGELGPIGGMNFVHGYTASIALFRPAGG
jgi:small ligand-binding sensory domain FIST